MVTFRAMDGISDEEAERVWKSLDRKITSITIHFEGGASMQMSLKTFKKLTNLELKDKESPKDSTTE